MMNGYPEYKESGVDWLGQIPTAWNKCKLGYIFQIVNGSTPASGNEDFWNGDIDWVTPSDLSKLNSFKIFSSKKKITKQGLESCGTSLIPASSVILSTRAPIGSLAIAESTMCTNQGCKSLVPRSKNIDTKFFYYILLVSTEQLNLRGRGTTFLELPTNELASFIVPKVAYQTQTQIVHFLDRETSRIDDLISEKQNFIKLLQEKRQALISHVVTKGLDESVKMKDSGVEWIGAVPEHWELGKLKHLVLIKNGQDYKHVETDDYNAFPVYGSGGIFKYATDFLHDGESILYGRKGTIDKPLHVNGKFWSVDTMFYSVLKEGANGRFVYYLSTTIPFSLYQTNTALPSMTQHDLLNNPITYPIYAEQELIANYLDQQVDKISAISKETQCSIELLKERRAALISAAVTGKIDVREEV